MPRPTNQLNIALEREEEIIVKQKNDEPKITTSPGAGWFLIGIGALFVIAILIGALT